MVDELEVGSLLLVVEFDLVWDVCLRDREVEFDCFDNVRVVEGVDPEGNPVEESVLRQVPILLVLDALEDRVDTSEDALDALDDAKADGVWSGNRLVRHGY